MEVDGAHVAHDAGAKVDAVEEGAILFSRDAVGGGGAVEGPCFGGEGTLGYVFEVLEVDKGVEGLFIGGAGSFGASWLVACHGVVFQWCSRRVTYIIIHIWFQQLFPKIWRSEMLCSRRCTTRCAPE